MEEVKLHLDAKKIKKLMTGKLVQLKAGDLKGSNCALALHLENAKKIKRARKQDKGVRLQLSAGEIEASASGEGIKEVFEKIKNGAKKFKNFYDENLKKTVAPVLKKLVKEGKDMGIDALKMYNPAVGMVVDELDDRVGDKSIDSLGRITGAFGKKGRKKSSGIGVQNDDSGVYDPKILIPDGLYVVRRNPSGGFGFLPAGMGFKAPGY